MDIHQAAVQVYGLEKLPFQQQLEQEFGQSLDWIRIRLGQREALYYLRRDWLIHGECILFSQREPSLDVTRAAVNAVMVRRKHLER